MTPRLAAHATIHHYPGGSIALGPMMGVSPSFLREAVNPHGREKSLSLERASQLMALTNDFRILCALCEEHGFMPPIPMPDYVVSDAALLETYTHLLAELGEFSKAFNESLTDGRITRREVEQMRGEMMDFIAAAETLLNRIEQVAE